MWLRVGWAAACFAAIMGFSRLAYGVLVPAMRASLGGSFALYGAIGGANMIGYLAGSLLTTRLARRPDRARVNVTALASMCAAMAACGFVREPIALGVLRFAVGVASGIALALTLALAVERIPSARRGVAAAIVWGGGCAGIAIAGAATAFVSPASATAWRIEWIAMAAVGAVFTAV
ncbi:MAG: YbfB/YjiJ family MFS transporter, partial [Candidatus Eremiobacteraeota bacterium]|nr:YbfB/YjiJ family MFS transporter [Candidatus Eremiobacteraeota bacterium]